MFGPPSVFVNKVLLEHCMCLSSCTVSGCLCTTVNASIQTVWSSKVKTLTMRPFEEKCHLLVHQVRPAFTAPADPPIRTPQSAH